MSVLKTSPTFVPRKRNIGTCAPPWGRGLLEPLGRDISVRCRLFSPGKLAGADWQLHPPGGSPIDKMAIDFSHESKRYRATSSLKEGVCIHFPKTPPGAPCQINLVNRTGIDPGIPRTLLHTTTGNRLKLRATENVALRLSSRKNGYWRARAVADVRGSPNARFSRRRLTFIDSSTCTSGHSNHGPPGCVSQQLPQIAGPSRK